jgi:O-antigen ligase
VEDQARVIDYLNLQIETAHLNSNEVRLNLLLNGIDFIKEEPLIGIGPGAFRMHHKEHKVSNPTETVIGAHNFPIEIVSQYGLFGWLYLLIVLSILIAFLLKYKKNKQNGMDWIIAFFIFLPLLWLLPSSFLYLDLNWMILPLLIILFYRRLDMTELNESNK